MSEKQYLNLLERVLEEGEDRGDRTGTGTKSLFGPQLEFDLNDGFPLLTTKKMAIRAIIHELLWFISGDTNIQYLQDNNVHIWDEWADADGELGPVYGEQWRQWGNYLVEDCVDQLQSAISRIRSRPMDRRIIVTAWNPSVLPDEGLAPCLNPPQGLMALAPCHCLFQFYVHTDGALDCKLYQRSADIFLGVPFNIASYALLTMMVAHVCDLTPGRFIHTFGDVHLYNNHMNQAREQLSRAPFDPPRMILDQSVSDIDDFRFEHFKLEDYTSHAPIKAPISV